MLDLCRTARSITSMNSKNSQIYRMIVVIIALLYSFAPAYLNERVPYKTVSRQRGTGL
jgi:hypothetical protein